MTRFVIEVEETTAQELIAAAEKWGKPVEQVLADRATRRFSAWLKPGSPVDRMTRYFDVLRVRDRGCVKVRRSDAAIAAVLLQEYAAERPGATVAAYARECGKTLETSARTTPFWRRFIPVEPLKADETS
ncbi:hypothetical protein ACFYNY_34510 [Streptomyces sp. NPDC006530]|uniref:hypothetical protein n=1 Tax=Streptomyces sp. NPDC006530 TaxID=3364750 RepID=UPI0036905D5C